MTSQSHKKRRITRPSTDRANPPSEDFAPGARIGMLFLIGLAVFAVTTWAEESQPTRIDTNSESRRDASAAERRWAELRALYLGDPRSTAQTPFVDQAPQPAPAPQVIDTTTKSEDGKIWTRLDNFPGAELMQALPASNSAQVNAPSPAPIVSEGVSPIGAVLADDPAETDRFLRPIETSLPSAIEPVDSSLSPIFDDVLIRDELVTQTAQLPPADLGNDIRLGPDISDRLKLKPLSDIVPSKDYAPSGEDVCQFTCPAPADCPDARCPDQIELPSKGNPDRYFGETMYHWAASNVRYNPLYFEDARLERYGHHIVEPIQSLKSVGLFAAQFASLPYQMAIDPIHESVSPLGFYRPGEAAPCLKRAIPVNGKAAATAAGAYTGLIFLIP